MTTTTSHITCPLCEATCGLTVTTSGRTIEDIRGDRDDVFSAGYICPKAYALKELEADPDRLRQPLVRRDGRLVPATWDEAFAEIDRGLGKVFAEHGRNAVAVYLGNPNAHHLSGLYMPALIKALGTRNVFSASTVDQMPKQVSAGLMFGTVPLHPRPRPRSHRLPIDVGREPPGVERQLDDRARHQRTSAAPARARRQARGDRSPSQPDGPRGRRPPFHPSRHRRAPSLRDRARAARRGPHGARSARASTSRASTTSSVSPVRSRPKPSPR